MIKLIIKIKEEGLYYIDNQRLVREFSGQMKQKNKKATEDEKKVVEMMKEKLKLRSQKILKTSLIVLVE